MDSIFHAAHIVPQQRQINWQRTEFYAFIHFGVNTFTRREWGDGTENPKIFNPKELSAKQWVKSFKAAGMKGAILTAKHHDGFCLWPSKFTEHSVKNSTWKNGEGDVLKEFVEACREEDFKVGFYLSPWDRHEKCYGTEAYNDYFVNQLTEILTQYGDVFCVWFDGACGEGPNGKKQVYDWERYYQVIRELQPEAVINVCGPDVRWCGNEAGHCRPSEWSVVPEELSRAERVEERSQKVDDGEFGKKINSSEDDLGSREKIGQGQKLIWYPAEVNTSIRNPHWFYNVDDNEKLRSTDNLVDLYLKSVGGNACLLLNIPPDERGLIHEVDVDRLKAMGEKIHEMFSKPIRNIHHIKVNTNQEKSAAIIDDAYDTYWTGIDGENTLEFNLDKAQDISYIELQEYIEKGQRVEKFAIDIKENNEWHQIFEGSIIGYKKICHVNLSDVRAIRVRLLENRCKPRMRSIKFYA